MFYIILDTQTLGVRDNPRRLHHNLIHMHTDTYISKNYNSTIIRYIFLPRTFNIYFLMCLTFSRIHEFVAISLRESSMLTLYICRCSSRHARVTIISSSSSISQVITSRPETVITSHPCQRQDVVSVVRLASGIYVCNWWNGWVSLFLSPLLCVFLGGPPSSGSFSVPSDNGSATLSTTSGSVVSG